MQIIRTLIWIAVAAVWVAFLVLNWGEPAQVIIWPLEASYLQFDWPVSVIALVFFLLGLVPTWLLYRAARWRWQRRIASLEHSVRAIAVAPPLATSTQLEAQQPTQSEQAPA